MNKQPEYEGILEVPDGLDAPVAMLLEDPTIQVRGDAAADEELIATIRENGVHTPLIVREVPGDNKHLRVVDGHRRLNAAKTLGLEFLPIRYREGMTDVEAIITSLTSKTQRGYTQLEQAEAYDRLRKLGIKEEEISSRLGISKRTVTEALRVLDKAIDAVKKDPTINPRTKARLAGLAPDEQKRLIDQVSGKSREEGTKVVRAAEKSSGKKTRGRKPVSTTKPLRANIKQCIDELEERVNTALKAEPKSLRFRVIRDVVDYFRNIGDINDLLSAKMPKNPPRAVNVPKDPPKKKIKSEKTVKIAKAAKAKAAKAKNPQKPHNHPPKAKAQEPLSNDNGKSNGKIISTEEAHV